MLTLFARYREIPSQEVIHQHLVPFSILFIAWVLVFIIVGLYDRGTLLARKELPGIIIRAQIVNILIAGMFFFFLPWAIAPKTNLVIYLMFSVALIALWRLYAFPLLMTEKALSVLVVGDSTEATVVGRTLLSNPYYKNVEVFRLASSDVDGPAELRESIFEFAEKKKVDIIIADMRDPYIKEISKDFYTLSFTNQDVQFFDLPTMYEQLYHRIPPSLIAETWLLEHVSTRSPHYAYDFLKRTVDIVGALVLAVPALVLFPLIALAIKLDDKGPLFYVTERIGQYNRLINIIKFRSMTGRDEGDAALKSELVVTRVGKFLRRTRLDELPQLVNVLRGDLSFIGPRPEIPALASVYAENIPYYNLRHLIKPGLSGWAQLYGKHAHHGVGVEETRDKLSLDLYYLKHRSFLLDIEIALKTINTLLQRTGT